MHRLSCAHGNHISKTFKPIGLTNTPSEQANDTDRRAQFLATCFSESASHSLIYEIFVVPDRIEKAHTFVYGVRRYKRG